MAACPRCDWGGDFIEVAGSTESQCPNCGWQGSLDHTSYEDLKKDELLALCEERDIECDSRMTKAELIELLQNP